MKEIIKRSKEKRVWKTDWSLILQYFFAIKPKLKSWKKIPKISEWVLDENTTF